MKHPVYSTRLKFSIHVFYSFEGYFKRVSYHFAHFPFLLPPMSSTSAPSTLTFSTSTYIFVKTYLIQT